MIETTKCAEVTKKNIPITNKENYMCETGITTKSEIVAQLLNEMKTLIQEIKTIIRAVTENKTTSQKDTNIEIATNKENPKALITEVDSVTRPPQTSPKRDSTKNFQTNREMALN